MPVVYQQPDDICSHPKYKNNYCTFNIYYALFSESGATKCVDRRKKYKKKQVVIIKYIEFSPEEKKNQTINGKMSQNPENENSLCMCTNLSA